MRKELDMGKHLEFYADRPTEDEFIHYILDSGFVLVNYDFIDHHTVISRRLR